MTADSIPQLKQPFLPLHRSAAQEYIRLYTNVLYPFTAHYLIDVHRQQLMLVILHSDAKRADVPVGAAHRDHIYRADILFQTAHSFLLVNYSTFVLYNQVYFSGCQYATPLLYYS